jgi:hypothetical protein
MEREFKSKNILIDGIIIIVALIVALNLHHSNEAKKKSLFQEKTGELNKNAVLGEIASLEKMIGSYKSQVNKNPDDSSRIISVINSIAQQAGVTINSTRPEQKQASAFFTKDRYALNFTAKDYHALGNFISRLETNTAFFLTVENISLQKQALASSGDENENQISAQITVSALFLN